MKGKKLLCVLCTAAIAASAAVSVFAAGCKKADAVGVERTVNHSDVAPDFTAHYQAETEALLSGLTEENTNDTAAKLFAYACYNERHIGKYVYFLDQSGSTDLGKHGSATAMKQEYYLRWNADAVEEQLGYKYHYTIKKALNPTGDMAGNTVRGFFEGARLRFVDGNGKLFRFELRNDDLDKIYLNEDTGVLTADWETGSDWDKDDGEMKTSDAIAPADIAADIEDNADDDNRTIRCNVNILKEGAVKSATVQKGSDTTTVEMVLNTEVLNADSASQKMLKNANSAKNIKWVSAEGNETGLKIKYTIWNSGLFKSYEVDECWQGKVGAAVIWYEGTAVSHINVKYSYDSRDTDMEKNLQFLEQAKEARG